MLDKCDISSNSEKIEPADWKSLSAEELDEYSGRATCQWHLHSNIEVIRNGLDFSELTRFFLLDKVPRAIRKIIDPNIFIPELESNNVNSKIQWPKTLIKSCKHAAKPTYNRIRNIYRQTRLKRLHANLRDKKIVYVPKDAVKLRNVIRCLNESKNTAIVVGQSPTKLPLITRIYRAPLAKNIENPDLEYASKLHKGILKGLRFFGIALIDEDAALLKKQIIKLECDINLLAAEFRMIRPHATLIVADNVPSHQAYVQIGRQKSITSIMLQHGLDCRHYSLDEAYADAIGVWGQARLKRYQRDSAHQPSLIKVTGNPEYKDLRLPKKLSTDGKYWLWATSTHRLNKSYPVSRNLHREGIEIFKALLDILTRTPKAQLVIKPHKHDDLNIYRHYLANNKLKDRIKISNSKLETLIPKANAVITEDSTAGMDAMFFGKIVIHAHFAKTSPATPFIEYGAALPAYSKDMLRRALQHAPHLTESESVKMLEAQRTFIRDHAGPCDGKQDQRIITFIHEVLKDI